MLKRECIGCMNARTFGLIEANSFPNWDIVTRGGGGGVLRFGSDGGVPLKPPNQYLSLRVIWRKRVPIIKGF